MDTFLTAIKSVFDNLGATVLLPVIIFFLAVILGTKPGRAFRSAVTIGIAFIGINLVINLMWGTLTEVGQAMVTNTGLERNVIDVGWPAAAAIAFSTQVGLWVIPIAILDVYKRQEEQRRRRQIGGKGHGLLQRVEPGQ